MYLNKRNYIYSRHQKFSYTILLSYTIYKKIKSKIYYEFNIKLLNLLFIIILY